VYHVIIEVKFPIFKLLDQTNVLREPLKGTKTNKWNAKPASQPPHEAEYHIFLNGQSFLDTCLLE
jgi:hypothetical protein